MKEKLSALMDGECAEADLAVVLAALKNAPALRDAWDTYHAIGDALRGHTGTEFAARVGRRMAQEPAVLAPAPLPAAPGRAVRYAMPAAAGVTAVALVVWTALSLTQPRPQFADSDGMGAPIVPVAADAPAAQPQQRIATPESVMPCYPATPPQPPSSSSR